MRTYALGPNRPAPTRVLPACVFGLLLGLSVPPAWADDFVDRNGTRFTRQGETFYFSHTNNYYLWYKPAVMVDEILRDAKALGLTAVRVFAFCEAQDKNGFCFQREAGVYDEPTFEKLDDVVRRAKALRRRLIVTLVNNWDDGFGGMRQYVNWAKAADLSLIPEDLREPWLETAQLRDLDRGACETNPDCDFNKFQRYHDLFYTNPHAKQLYQSYVAFMLNRYKHESTILMWELANEPRAESDPQGETLSQWIAEMAAFIKLRDPNHLLSTGEEGWFNDPVRAASVDPSQAWRYDGSLGVDFVGDHRIPGIDACSFHLLPNDNGMDEAASLAWIAEHAQACHQEVGKPVYMGEFAWKVDRWPDETVLYTFAQDAEGWSRAWDVGFTADSPRWVAQPAFDGDGALEYLADPATFAPGSDGGGAVQYPDDQPLDASAFHWLGGYMLLPDNAPQDLLGDFFTQSGPDWEWRDGDDVLLQPGSWHRVQISTNQIAHPEAIRRIGMRLKTFNSSYDGAVWYDRVAGLTRSVNFNPAMMADRNRIYADWRAAAAEAWLDGSGFWFLNGMLEDGVSPHDDDGPYGVFYPEDAQTATVIRGLAQDMATRSGDQFRLWESCEAGGRTAEPASSYSDATGVSLSKKHSTHARHACQLAYDPAKGFAKAYWEFANLNDNWAARPQLLFDVFSPSAGLQLSVVVSTGPDWTWHESQLYTLQAGRNVVAVDLRSSDWKTEASGWQNVVPIEHLDQVQRLSLGLFGYGAAPNAIWVDKIRLTALPRVIGLRIEGRNVRWQAVDDQGRSSPGLVSSYRVDAGTWSAWQPRNRILLSDLAATYGTGEHVFEVKVRDPAGIESEPKALLITLP